MKKTIAAIRDLSPMGEIVLIDIGARWGVQRPWNSMPADSVAYYGFDADSAECKKLNEARNYFNQTRYLPYALSDRSSEEKFYVTDVAGASSFFKPNYKYLDRYHFNEYYKIKEEIYLKTTTMLKVLSEEKIVPDFVKLDTQGFELNILKGMGRFIDEVLGMEIEVEFLPTYEGQPLFAEIDAFARNNGFELFDLNRYWGNRVSMRKDCSSRGQVVFADAVYFRSCDSFYAIHKNAADKKGKLLKMVSSLILYGFFDVALEFIKHPDTPLTAGEIKAIEDICVGLSAYPKWQKVLFNNRLAGSIGRWLLYLGNMLSYKLKNYGWGTDYNSVDGRYLYHLNGRMSAYFKK